MRNVLLFCGFFLLLVGLKNNCSAHGNDGVELDQTPRPESPWMGYDFVFCFVTDDGQACNSAWVDVGLEMDFRFTISINSAYNQPTKLTGEQLHGFWVDGFEIANHSYSHGLFGLPESCDYPPRGSMAGYFMCKEITPEQALIDFVREIDRDSLATKADIPVDSIKSFVYPNGIHTKVVIDSLVTEGYLGARIVGEWDEAHWSYGDFTTRPLNGWYDGMSLFRMPLTIPEKDLFGNHSAEPPVYFSYDEFETIAQPWIDYIKNKNGVFVLYTHHLGNHDDSYGDINYSFGGGVTPQDLAWIVELVRANNGVVLTFGEMSQYYRDRSTMVLIDGDYVWQQPQSPVIDTMVPSVLVLNNFPNPFNPRTVVSFNLSEDCHVSAKIFDSAGRLVVVLDQGSYQAGEHHLIWDGVNSSGRMVPTGQYYLKVEAGDMVGNQKMLLLK